MKLSSVHHIAIICSNYEISKKFYKEILNLKIIKETYRSERESYKLDLAVGEYYQIELFSFKEVPTRPSNQEAAGLRHLAFEVSDVQEHINELLKHGIVTEPIRIDELSNKKFTFFADPDGLPLELYEK